MIRTDVVMQLRDLRGEHLPTNRRIRWAERSGPDGFARYRQLEAVHLLELALTALEWRKEDRYDAPEGQHAQLAEEVLYLVRDLAGIVAQQGQYRSLIGADIAFLVSWEPAT